LCFLAISSVTPILVSERRLIETEPNRPAVWMSQEKAFELKKSGKNFLDITDNKELGTKNNRAPNVTVPIPTKVTQQAVYNTIVGSLSQDIVLSNLATLSGLNSRYYQADTGKQAAEWIYGQLNLFKGNRTDIEVMYFDNPWKQASVIARFLGATSTNTVVLGAHEDSVNWYSSGPVEARRAPGADDDGSGTVTILEVFRVLATSGYRPNNTLEIQFYAAEEVGLLGSQRIVARFVEEKRVVRGMMQMDMTGYIGSAKPSIAVVTDYTSKELTAFLRLLVDAYSNLPWEDTTCGYGCSDHASWYKAGYAACFPFESKSLGNPNIHSVNDTIAQLNPAHMMEFVQIGLGYVIEMSATNNENTFGKKKVISVLEA